MPHNEGRTIIAMQFSVKIDKTQEALHFKHLDRLVNELSLEAMKTTEKAAKQYVAILKSGMGQKTTPHYVKKQWPQLTASWRARKTQHKDDFWVHLGGVYHNIRVTIIAKQQSMINIFTGIRKVDGADEFQRAATNEYGYFSKPFKGRPLFRPAANLISIKSGQNERRLKRTSNEWRWFKYDTVRNAIRRAFS